MKLLRAFVFLFFAGIASGNAQSVVHFSLYEMNPLYVNPAKSGDFLGTVRVGGLYREQWGFSNVTTPFAFFDSPILNGFRKKKDELRNSYWISILFIHKFCMLLLIRIKFKKVLFVQCQSVFLNRDKYLSNTSFT